MSNQEVSNSAYSGVKPYIEVSSANNAINFYTNVFGAKVIKKYEKSGYSRQLQRVYFAEIEIDGSRIMISDAKSYKKNECGNITLNINVSDVDALVALATNYGATIVLPAENKFWGDRMAVIRDPYGIKWGINRHERDVSSQNIQAKIDSMDIYLPQYRQNNPQRNYNIGSKIDIYKFINLQ